MLNQNKEKRVVRVSNVNARLTTDTMRIYFLVNIFYAFKVYTCEFLSYFLLGCCCWCRRLCHLYILFFHLIFFFSYFGQCVGLPILIFWWCVWAHDIKKIKQTIINKRLCVCMCLCACATDYVTIDKCNLKSYNLCDAILCVCVHQSLLFDFHCLPHTLARYHVLAQHDQPDLF